MEISKPQAILNAYAALSQALSNHGVSGLSSQATSLLLGQALGESMFGADIAGYKKTMAGTNNWGSVQSTKGWESENQSRPGFGKFAHRDSHADGSPYVGWYRLYPNQLEGANGFVATVLYDRGDFQTAVEGGADAYATYLKAHGYYEAPEDQYAKLISGTQAQINSSLAQTSGLTAADPTATSDLSSLAPLDARVGADLASQVPSNGIVYFAGPAAGGSILATLTSGAMGPIDHLRALPTWQKAALAAGGTLLLTGVLYAALSTDD